MTRLPVVYVTSTLLVLCLTGSGSRLAFASSTAPMSVKVLSVSPHVVSKKNQLVTVHVRLTGITMDPLHMGEKPAAGRGHMQLYLNHIPSGAYSHAIVKEVVANATTDTFSVALTPYWRKAAHGRHQILIALARNDFVLYHVSPAAFVLTVK